MEDEKDRKESDTEDPERVSHFPANKEDSLKDGTGNKKRLSIQVQDIRSRTDLMKRTNTDFNLTDGQTPAALSSQAFWAIKKAFDLSNIEINRFWFKGNWNQPQGIGQLPKTKKMGRGFKLPYEYLLM